MKKRDLSTEEILRISESIQLAMLGGIAGSRRWERGEIAFQGGTCLRLVYGSPRFSEDLDFVAASDAGLERVARQAAATARARLGAGEGWTWEIKGRQEDAAGQPKNPRTFTLTVQAPDWYRAIKVKLEFWVAKQEVVHGYPATSQMTKPLDARFQLPHSLSAHPQVLLDAATLEAIAVDKVYAIASREYLKPRDWFDLWWLTRTYPEATPGRIAEWSRVQLPNREAMYPGGLLVSQLRERLEQRIAEVAEHPEKAARDIARWLALDRALATNSAHIVDEALTIVRAVSEALDDAPAPRSARRARRP